MKEKIQKKERGVLIAEGDSWFDYIIADDVLDILEDYGYSVESVSHKGDSMLSMAYRECQFKEIIGKLKKLKKRKKIPKAILLSGGGNDFTGENLAILLNPKNSGFNPLNRKMAKCAIDNRLRKAYVWLIRLITESCEKLFGKKIPILVHGYAYVVPDGRGVGDSSWTKYLPFMLGPWLEPAFSVKGYDDHDSLKKNTETIKKIIKRFNKMLASLASENEFAHVKYVNLRGLLSNDLKKEKYKKYWANELHPTEKGFKLVAKKFKNVIENL